MNTGPMCILVDITHPAHVHFFKHAVWKWQQKGHKIIITSRDKDLTLDLLDRYDFTHTNLSRVRKGVVGLGRELLIRGCKLLGIVRRERPDVMTAIGATFIAPVGGLTRTPVVLFTDTEPAAVSNAIAFPFAQAIVTPSCYEAPVRRKQITYKGYQELAYLHPDYFTPDPKVVYEFGVQPDECYIVMRFVSWEAGHDIGDSGFTSPQELLKPLAQYGRVLITSEKPLPLDMEPCRISVSPEKIHHLLAYATLYIGESATMASESAILGTPSIFVSTSTRGYTNEQERKYGLVYTFSDPQTAQDDALYKAEELLSHENLREEWQTKRWRMLGEKEDVTAFVVSLVERYGR